MCNLYSITTNQAAIINLFRVINRYVGNLQPMPGAFPSVLDFLGRQPALTVLPDFNWKEKPVGVFGIP
jgi:hypothetical protein